jgi:hypothetical protein
LDAPAVAPSPAPLAEGSEELDSFELHAPGSNGSQTRNSESPRRIAISPYHAALTAPDRTAKFRPARIPTATGARLPSGV